MQTSSPTTGTRLPATAHLTRRIMVVGYGGKSTLARAIAAKHGLAHVELDALFWKPDWKQSLADEFQAKIEDAIGRAPAGWVVDGSYFGTIGGLVISQAETVVFINMPWRVMFWRMFLRSIKRICDKQRICGDNYESFRQTFLSRKSLLWWHITNRKRYKTQRGRLLPLVPPQAWLIELNSAEALDRFCRDNELDAPGRASTLK